MGREAVPPAGLLMVAATWRDEEALVAALRLAEDAFGPAEARSEPFPFDPFTPYYAAEMGTGLRKGFWTFARPLPRGALAEAKLASNRMERRLARAGSRRVNLDPGLLTAESLVLATTKLFAHRVYLGKGIFAELELVFRQGRFEPLPWTYPDYRQESTRSFLAGARPSAAPKDAEEAPWPGDP